MRARDEGASSEVAAAPLQWAYGTGAMDGGEGGRGDRHAAQHVEARGGEAPPAGRRGHPTRGRRVGGEARVVAGARLGGEGAEDMEGVAEK